MKPSGMHTSVGIAEEAIDRTGRSGHPLFAAAAVAGNRTIAQNQTWWNQPGNLLDTGNDYNRRYPDAFPFRIAGASNGLQT